MPLQRSFRRWRHAGWLVPLSLIFACNQSPTAVEEVGKASAKVAQAAAAVTGQRAPMADAAERGSFLGFDTYTYPGDDKMRTWRNAPNAPYRWVGYYLPSAVCYKGSSWSGKRATLTDMGWGLAVVYVGQQTWNRPLRSLTAAQEAAQRAKGVRCNADFIDAPEGAADAQEAITKTRAEGFPRGTVIFLDIERMETVPVRMRDYYRAWVATVLRDGSFRPGIYVHSFNARLVYDDVKALFAAAGIDEEPRFWIASARDFSPEKAARDVGHEFAGMWQGVIDVVREVANVALPIDINVSNWPSPSDVTD